jgi:hypothetical protein
MNKLIGGSLLICVTMLTSGAGVKSTLSAHGPVAPPDADSDVTYVAHGPVAPPDADSDAAFFAHGPVAPPDADSDMPYAV